MNSNKCVAAINIDDIMKENYAAIFAKFIEPKISDVEYRYYISKDWVALSTNRGQKVLYSIELLAFLHHFINTVKNHTPKCLEDLAEWNAKIQSYEICYNEFVNDARAKLCLTNFLSNVLYVATHRNHKEDDISVKILCDMLNDAQSANKIVRSIFCNVLNLPATHNEFTTVDFKPIIDQLRISNIALAESTLAQRIGILLLQYLNTYFIKHCILDHDKKSKVKIESVDKELKLKFLALTKYLDHFSVEADPITALINFMNILVYKYDFNHKKLLEELDIELINDFLNFANLCASYEMHQLMKCIFQEDATGKFTNLSDDFLHHSRQNNSCKEILGKKYPIWLLLQCIADHMPLLDENIANIVYMRNVCAYFFTANSVTNEMILKKFIEAATVNNNLPNIKAIEIMRDLLNMGFVDNSVARIFRHLLHVKKDFHAESFAPLISSDDNDNIRQHKKSDSKTRQRM